MPFPQEVKDAVAAERATARLTLIDIALSEDKKTGVGILTDKGHPGLLAVDESKPHHFPKNPAKIREVARALVQDKEYLKLEEAYRHPAAGSDSVAADIALMGYVGNKAKAAGLTQEDVIFVMRPLNKSYEQMSHLTPQQVHDRADPHHGVNPSQRVIKPKNAPQLMQ